MLAMLDGDTAPLLTPVVTKPKVSPMFPIVTRSRATEVRMLLMQTSPCFVYPTRHSPHERSRASPNAVPRIVHDSTFKSHGKSRHGLVGMAGRDQSNYGEMIQIYLRALQFKVLGLSQTPPAVQYRVSIPTPDEHTRESVELQAVNTHPSSLSHRHAGITAATGTQDSGRSTLRGAYPELHVPHVRPNGLLSAGSGKSWQAGDENTEQGKSMHALASSQTRSLVAVGAVLVLYPGSQLVHGVHSLEPATAVNDSMHAWQTD